MLTACGVWSGTSLWLSADVKLVTLMPCCGCCPMIPSKFGSLERSRRVGAYPSADEKSAPFQGWKVTESLLLLGEACDRSEPRLVGRIRRMLYFILH